MFVVSQGKLKALSKTKSNQYSSEKVATAFIIPGFLLGFSVKLTILPYFSRAFLSFSSVVSALKPPIKAMKFYFEAKGLRTKVLSG